MWTLAICDVGETTRDVGELTVGETTRWRNDRIPYDGHVLYEIIDKKKMAFYFYWLKENNDLFAELELSPGILHDFERQIGLDALQFEKTSIPTKVVEEEDVNVIRSSNENVDIDVILENVIGNNEHDENMVDAENKINIQHQHSTIMCNKYQQNIEETTVVNKIASTIVDLESKGVFESEFLQEYGNDNDDVNLKFKETKDNLCNAAKTLPNGNEDIYGKDKLTIEQAKQNHRFFSKK